MNSRFRSVRCQAVFGVAAIALMPGIAIAQTTPAQAPPEDAQAAQTAAVEQQAVGGVANTSSESTTDTDIVVTGTLLRGTAPVGSNVISVGQDRVRSQGVTSTNELLGTIPQVSNFFNNVPTTSLVGAVQTSQTNRPNLRNLSSNTSSSASTLVLFDGHRIAGAGVTQSTVDPDLIPTGAIERVEVVTDGGSSTYGADAVGGVINFITRRRFNGVQADVRYGFANDYATTSANGTVGKDWGTGSLYASYSFNKNDSIFGRDRDFIRAYDYSVNPAVPATRLCSPANIAIAGTNYAYPTGALGGVRCDASDNGTILPSQERHGGIVSLSQDLNSAISVDVKAFYGRRETRSEGIQAATVTIGSANPFYFPVPGVTGRPSQTVNFSFSPVFDGDSGATGTTVAEWGANAEFKARLGSNFQLRTLLNYSRSNSAYFINALNATAITAAAAGTTTATALNPYDLSATNPAVLANIRNYQLAGQSKDDQFNGRAIIDGSLLTLPGGEVKVALGYEYIGDEFAQRFTNGGVRGAINQLPYVQYSRQVHAGFGEIQVPIFGEGNRTGGLYSLLLSGSARYDHYSDFGGTFNPKVGASYKPVSWFTIRGNYGTSFNAPTPVDQLGSSRNSILVVPFAAFVRPGDNVSFFGNGTVALTGANSNLQPQTAKTWSVGADIDLPFVEGLHASASYYNVKFDNILATPTSNAGIFRDFPNNAQTNVAGIAPATVRAFAAQDPNGLAQVNALIAAGTPIYELVDFRTGNYGILRVSGLDYAVNYRVGTGFGGVDASVSGNYQLDRKFQSSPGAPTVNQLLLDQPRFTLQGTLGTDIGGFRAQATLNHTSGYDFTQRAGDISGQTRVSDFDVVNLFFKYDVPASSGVLQGLSFTANVNNVLDQDPPVYRFTGANGYANGFTLGRLFLFGISKKF
jgi:iron complex outermembrane receptor protein